MPERRTRHTFCPHEDSFYESSDSDSDDGEILSDRAYSSTPSLIIDLYYKMHWHTKISERNNRIVKEALRRMLIKRESSKTNSSVSKSGQYGREVDGMKTGKGSSTADTAARNNGSTKLLHANRVPEDAANDNMESLQMLDRPLSRLKLLNIKSEQDISDMILEPRTYVKPL